MKHCPECISEIPENAKVCKFCGERIEGQLCTECSSYCPVDAKTCKWCGCKFSKQPLVVIDGEEFSVQAEYLFTLLNLSRHPQEATFSKDKIVITSHGFFGLISRNEEIPWEKVAGFSHTSGIFWDHIYIETRGQTGGAIGGLSPENGVKIKQILQRLEV